MANEPSAQIDIRNQSNQTNSPIKLSAGEVVTRVMASLVDQPVSDSSSLYYMHYGDNTRMRLINVMLEENYATWSRALIMALSIKTKEGFIDESIVKPSLNDLLYGSWRRCNHVVSSWINNSIPKEQYPSVMHKDSAGEIWIELKDRYSYSNSPRIYELKKQIASIS